MVAPDMEIDGKPPSMFVHTEPTFTCSERVSEASAAVGWRPENVVPSLFTASPVPLMLMVRSTAAPTSLWQGCAESLVVQKGQFSISTLNLTVPALTPNDSVPVGVMVPASRNTKVVTVSVAALFTGGGAEADGLGGDAGHRGLDGIRECEVRARKRLGTVKIAEEV